MTALPFLVLAFVLVWTVRDAASHHGRAFEARVREQQRVLGRPLTAAEFWELCR
jgi:hypothetical protein